MRNNNADEFQSHSCCSSLSSFKCINFENGYPAERKVERTNIFYMEYLNAAFLAKFVGRASFQEVFY